MPVTSTEIAWIAGILEGEGSFKISNTGSPRICLSMTDLDIIEKFRYITNTKDIKITTRAEGSYKIQYETSMNGTRAIQWMMTIYYLMGIRRKERIREILTKWQNGEFTEMSRNQAEKIKYNNAVKAIMISRKVSKNEAEKLLEQAMGGTIQ